LTLAATPGELLPVTVRRMRAITAEPAREPHMHRTLLPLVIAALALGACHRGKAPVEEEPRPNPYEFTADVPVVIENHHWAEVTIYVALRGQRSRIGAAVATQTTTLLIPRRVVNGYAGELRLIADPIGELRALVSESIHVRPGQTIQWTLESDLRRSTIAVLY
jgi:hypothetical protein